MEGSQFSDLEEGRHRQSSFGETGTAQQAFGRIWNPLLRPSRHWSCKAGGQRVWATRASMEGRNPKGREMVSHQYFLISKVMRRL